MRLLLTVDQAMTPAQVFGSRDHMTGTRYVPSILAALDDKND
jgi:hypothetical protein